VVVGLSGLTVGGLSPSATPQLWRLAAAGSVGALVDYAQQPLACPADGWLTLNSGARAQGPRPCGVLPAVVRDAAGARIPALTQIIAANQAYHESPRWGLLGSLARCSTAVGPGAALALAAADGTVASYLPSAAGLSRPALARCPLTVIDLGQFGAAKRERVTADRLLTQITAELPPGTTLLVTAPGAAAGAVRPHLMTVVVSGAGYSRGLLGASSTRQPGVVTLTDLTATVAAWLSRPVPAAAVGARITSARRAGLGPAVTALDRRDVAEQVWLSGHGWFFLSYAAAAALAFGLPALFLRRRDAGSRRRRARCWRAAGVAAVAVPLGSYLAGLFRWPSHVHPAWWLYGLTAGWTLLAAAAALAGPWRRDPGGPFGALCAATAALLAVDVVSGSRLQQEAPFGLSLLASGRFYGIGNDALGLYCVSVLVTVAWIGGAWNGRARVGGAWAAHLPRGRGTAGTVLSGPVLSGTVLSSTVLAGAVGLIAVVASGWPGFGAKVGGTIALVPCLILLVAGLAGVRVRRRLVLPVALSGVAVFAVFAVASYFLPAAGVSDMGAFAGSLVHGRGGDLIRRKAQSDAGSLTLSALGGLVPVAAAVSAVALARPAALRLRLLADAFAGRPLLRLLAWLTWLVLVLGWFADDSGVVVPGVALPFVLPLVIGLAAAVTVRDSVSGAPGGARYGGTAFAGPLPQADPRGLSEQPPN
jgi:hypothetical protein